MISEIPKCPLSVFPSFLLSPTFSPFYFEVSKQLPLLHPDSPTSCAIWPHICFKMRLRYWNSAPLMCAPSMGKSIGTRGACMSFDVCESSNLTHSVPLPRVGIAGQSLLKYRISLIFCFLDELILLLMWPRVPVPVVPVLFLAVPLSPNSIYNYLYIS